MATVITITNQNLVQVLTIALEAKGHGYLFWSILISWENRHIYIYMQWAYSIDTSGKQFWNFEDFPNIEVYNQNIWINIDPTISSKRTMLGKAYGTKWGAIGNMSRKTLGTWRICLDHIGNLKGTKKTQKIQHPHTLPNKKNKNFKKTGSIGCMLLALLHWLIFSNCVHHYFLPSLIPTPFLGCRCRYPLQESFQEALTIISVSLISCK